MWRRPWAKEHYKKCGQNQILKKHLKIELVQFSYKIKEILTSSPNLQKPVDSKFLQISVLNLWT